MKHIKYVIGRRGISKFITSCIGYEVWWPLSDDEGGGVGDLS